MSKEIVSAFMLLGELLPVVSVVAMDKAATGAVVAGAGGLAGEPLH